MPQKILEKYFPGNYHVKFGHCSAKYQVKFGNFVNFSGKYHLQFGHFVKISYIIFAQKCLAPKVD